MKKRKREGLKQRNGERFRVKAKVGRFGSKKGWNGEPEKTILLQNVSDAETGRLLADHLWMKAGKWSSGIKEGDTIAFDARVDEYWKGYFGRRDDVYKELKKDWHLERPTKVVRLDAQPIALHSL